MGVNIADETHYAQAASQLLDGVVTPFLGAGVNLSGRPARADGRPGTADWAPGCDFLPSGADLAAALADEVAYPDPDDLDLMRISQFVHSVLGWKPLYKYVRAPLDAMYPPTALHRFLAKIAGGCASSACRDRSS